MDHARYLDAWFDALELTENVTLVGHDRGAALGFHWAHRHPKRVRGLTYMEMIVCPLSWEEWPEEARDIFRTMHSEGVEELVLENNAFVEHILPSSVLRTLTDKEMGSTAGPTPPKGLAARPSPSTGSCPSTAKPRMSWI